MRIFKSFAFPSLIFIIVLWTSTVPWSWTERVHKLGVVDIPIVIAVLVFYDCVDESCHFVLRNFAWLVIILNKARKKKLITNASIQSKLQHPLGQPPAIWAFEDCIQITHSGNKIVFKYPSQFFCARQISDRDFLLREYTQFMFPCFLCSWKLTIYL